MKKTLLIKVLKEINTIKRNVKVDITKLLESTFNIKKIKHLIKF